MTYRFLFPRPTRWIPIALLWFVAACAAGDPREEQLPPMGDFRLSHNIVVADNMRQVPPSRNATPEEWEEVLVTEIDRRFGEYAGDRLYHIGVAVDGYALAPPGIPLLVNPRSILVLSVNIWDDARGEKLHEDPRRLYVLEGAAPETFIIGSGLARTRQQQMQVLARNAARRIQLWMLRNPEWFGIDADDAAEAAATVESVVEDVEDPIDVDAAAQQATADEVAANGPERSIN